MAKAAVKSNQSVTIERKSLLALLARTVSVVERRTTIPILSNILFSSHSDRLTITATDLERSVTSSTPCTTGSEKIETTIPAHIFMDIIKRTPDGADIVIETDNEKSAIEIRAGRSKTRLMTLSGDDFPHLERKSKTGDLKSFAMAADDLKAMLEQTAFAQSTEETRYYLNGVYLHTVAPSGGPPELRVVATDGHRLAQVKCAVPDGALGLKPAIVPRKTVHELLRLLGEAHGQDVNISVSERAIAVTSGDTRLVSKLIDGSYPDYERVIPRDNNIIVRVSSVLLSAAIERVLTIATERVRSVGLNVVNGEIVVHCRNPEGGNSEDVVEGAEINGKPPHIGFNGRYLADILDLCHGTAEILFNDQTSPTIFRSVGNENVLFVCMPMRL